jgi:hypothetical protein
MEGMLKSKVSASQQQKQQFVDEKCGQSNVFMWLVNYNDYQLLRKDSAPWS